MSRILLSPWNANWFGIAFSAKTLQLARTRCRLPQDAFPDERLAVMGESVLRGIYQPQEPAHFELTGEGKKPRILTIPQAPERLLQAAFARVLAMQLDPQLSPNSFAYRPKMSPMQAHHAALAWIKQGLRWIVRADIRAFFDQISPALLFTTIGHFVDDSRAQALMQSWLQKIKPSHAGGIAQGAPISPLLSNLYLDPLDRALAAQGIPALRYADDLVLFANSQTQAEQQLAELTQLVRTLALELADEKTIIGTNTEGIQFLGQTLGQLPLPAPKMSLQKPDDPIQPATQTSAQTSTQTAPPVKPPRKLIESRLRTLYLDQSGGYLKLSAGRLILTRQGKNVREFLLRHLDLIIVRGHLALSSAVLLACQQHYVSLVWMTPNGRVLGVQAGCRQSADILRAQCRRESQTGFCLLIAATMVAAKIEHQRVVLQRYARGRAWVGQQTDALLKRAASRSQVATNLDELRGIEGLAARDYFAGIGGLLDAAWQFHGRGKRPARDAVNALLSFGYSVLYANARALLEAVGLNPDIGLFHASRAGHAALASDLMEEFRALLVDSTVLKLVLNRRLLPAQFSLNTQGEMRIGDEARVDFLHALEAKMNALTGKEPTDLDYRRAIAAQAHKLRAVVLGEMAEYQAFRVR